MADTLYENYTALTSSFSDLVYESGIDGGTTWTALSDHDVSFVKLPLSLAAGAGTLTYGVFATAAGIPTGAALATGSIDITTIAGRQTMTKLQLDSKVAVTNGVMYAICLFGVGLTASAIWAFWQGNGPKYTGTQIKRATSGSDPWIIPNPNYYMRYEIWDGDLAGGTTHEAGGEVAMVTAAAASLSFAVVNLAPYASLKRLVSAGNNKIYYEDI